MKHVKRILAVVVVLLLLAAAWFVYRLNDRPRLAAYANNTFAAGIETGAGLRVTFLGVSTLLFDDGDTAILTDGFFTRPGKLRFLFTKIEPEPPLITSYLQRAGINHLAAVLVAHSHYDHALDAPLVARTTGALLVGSESTANIGRGSGLSRNQIKVANENEVMPFGRFRVAFVRAQHISIPFAPMGSIDGPLQPPARWNQYKEGGSYSVLIEHDGKSFLVQSSAGFVAGALQNRHAGVVFLGIGQLGTKEDAYKETYWREVVAAVKARRVIPIHWDDYWLPLDQPLVPLPTLLDDFEKSMSFLLARGGQEGIDVKILPAWMKVDPFAGLQNKTTPTKQQTSTLLKRCPTY